MLRISIYDSNNVLTNSNEFSTEELANSWYNYNHDYFPIPHTKTITSIVEEKLEIQRFVESSEAVDLGTNIIKQIRVINRRKLKLGIWSQDKFNQLLINPIAAQIERALWNGSLQTAGYLLTNMSDFYSDIEIQRLISLINEHEEKWSTLI